MRIKVGASLLHMLSQVPAKKATFFPRQAEQPAPKDFGTRLYGFSAG